MTHQLPFFLSLKVVLLICPFIQAIQRILLITYLTFITFLITATILNECLNLMLFFIIKNFFFRRQLGWVVILYTFCLLPFQFLIFSLLFTATTLKECNILIIFLIWLYVITFFHLLIFQQGLSVILVTLYLLTFILLAFLFTSTILKVRIILVTFNI